MLGFIASIAALVGISKLPADYSYNVGGHFDLRPKHLQITWAVRTPHHNHEIFTSFLVSLILFWITSAGAALFWSVGVSAVLVSLHAALHDVSIETDFSLPA